MKKAILIIATILITLTSCKKEVDANKQNTPVENCDCNEVVAIDNNGVTMGNGYAISWYDVRVKNECTNKISKMTINIKSSSSNNKEIPYIGIKYCN